jgi:hypothetical protein
MTTSIPASFPGMGEKKTEAQMAVNEIVSKTLHLRETDGYRDWRVWEYKSINMHRGVLHWWPRQPVACCAEITSAIRQRVGGHYRTSWWRGFAFGAIVEVSEFPHDVASIESCIDTRANSKGTWQWMVLVCPVATTAIGVHTWIEGYLAPTYRALLDHYQNLGYRTGGFMKDKDRLMQFLEATGRISPSGLLGLKDGRNFKSWEPKDG